MSELDREALEKLRRLEAQGNPGLVGEVVTMFLEQLEDRLQHLPAAAARGDARAVEADAHSLRGSASQLGASGIADVCGELERRASRGDLGDAPARIEQLRRAADRVRLELTALRGP